MPIERSADTLSHPPLVLPRTDTRHGEKEAAMILRKLILLLLLSIPLAGAVTTATPVPVLLVMTGLIVLAIAVTGRVEQKE